MNKTLIAYSSLTGNTKLVAEKIFEIVEGDKKLVSLNDIKDINTDEFNRIIVGFWVDKGTADKRTREFIKSFRKRDCILWNSWS